MEQDNYNVNAHKIKFLTKFIKKYLKFQLLTNSSILFYVIVTFYFKIYLQNLGSKFIHFCFFGYGSVVNVKV